MAAPIVGANTCAQIDDAVASVDLTLGQDELHQLQQPYTPRYDVQGLAPDSPEVRRINTQTASVGG